MKLTTLLRQLKNTLVDNPFSHRYVIRKGEQYCDRSAFRPVLVHTLMSFTVRFNESCRYVNQNPVNQWDINKLWGFTESLFSDRQSARVGWNYRGGKLYLRPYTHVDGKMPMDPPEVEVEIGQDIPCSIILMKGYYLFLINNTPYRLPRKGHSEWVLGRQQFPYFGGDEPASHDISITVK